MAGRGACAPDESLFPGEERERLAQVLALGDGEPGHVIKQGLHGRGLMP